MQPSHILHGLALALGGGALFLAFLRAPGGPPSTAAPMSGLAPPVDVAPELRALRAELEAMRQRLAFVEAQPVTAARAPAEGAVDRAEFEAFRAEVLAMLAGDGQVSGALAGRGAAGLQDAAAFTEQVAVSLEEIRKRERIEKAQASLEQQRAAIDDATLPKIATWLELSPSQREAMRQSLYAQLDRGAELTRLWEGGADPEFLSQQKSAMAAAQQAELEGFLTPAQLQTYLGRGK
ncbi:MAG: hypothetical protein R3F49_13165 [Planctomycetota bacterium]